MLKHLAPAKNYLFYGYRKLCSFQPTFDLPEIPDCVYLAVSRDQTVKLIKDISNMGVGGTVCLASRFSELNSKEGKDKTNELIKNSGKMPFLGPNCYGFINYLDKISVWSDQVSGKPTKKGVAIICQSGTIGNTIKTIDFELCLISKHSKMIIKIRNFVSKFMSCQSNFDSIPNIEPFWVMAHCFRFECHIRHKTKCFIKITKRECLVYSTIISFDCPTVFT